MGQSSISYLNKNGYSMFWNSMWDNKINYNKNIKEDIFLRYFFPYMFNDGISKNIILKLKNKNNNNYFNYKNTKLNNFLVFNNKLEFYTFRLWILKYQFWLILYNYIFICNFTKQSEIFINRFNTNFYNFYNFYNINLNFSSNKFHSIKLKNKIYF